MKELVKFAKHYLRDPKTVGAITPLNGQVAKELVNPIKKRLDIGPCKILEVGAGTGSITKEIVPLLKENDTLDLVEIDKKCCDQLHEKFQSFKNISVQCKSILEWTPDTPYDFIISTLPFNNFPIDLIKDILSHYQKISHEESLYSYVEYAGLHSINLVIAKREEKKMMETRKKFLKGFLNQHMVSKKCVIKNFPPCNVYHLKFS